MSNPISKQPCPYTRTNAHTGRLVGLCHEGKIIGCLDSGSSRPRFQIEQLCPLFCECKLKAKVKTATINNEQVPIRQAEPDSYPWSSLTNEEKQIVKQAYKKYKKKSANFVGKKTKQAKQSGKRIKPKTIQTKDGPLIIP